MQPIHQLYLYLFSPNIKRRFFDVRQSTIDKIFNAFTFLVFLWFMQENFSSPDKVGHKFISNKNNLLECKFIKENFNNRNIIFI